MSSQQSTCSSPWLSHLTLWCGEEPLQWDNSVQHRAVPLTYQCMQNGLCFVDMTHGHCTTGQPVLVRQRDVLQQHLSCRGKHPISRVEGPHFGFTNADKLGQQQL